LNLRVLAAACLLAATVPAAAQEIYVLDGAHSRPTFEVHHLGYSTQFGMFDKVSGKVALDRGAKKGSVDIAIDAASIRTFDARLDGAVKGDKFFNVEKFPTIAFKSTSLHFDGDRVTAVDGELTMLGVTKPLTLKIVAFKCGEQPFNKKPMCGGDATATLKRSDWGMTTGVSSLTPGDEVTLRVPFEAYRENAG
jgi:polyisoprenoid-binding protein YceI